MARIQHRDEPIYLKNQKLQALQTNKTVPGIFSCLSSREMAYPVLFSFPARAGLLLFIWAVGAGKIQWKSGDLSKTENEILSLFRALKFFTLTAPVWQREGAQGAFFPGIFPGNDVLPTALPFPGGSRRPVYSA